MCGDTDSVGERHEADRQSSVLQVEREVFGFGLGESPEIWILPPKLVNDRLVRQGERCRDDLCVEVDPDVSVELLL